jgi:hypothetical protein
MLSLLKSHQRSNMKSWDGSGLRMTIGHTLSRTIFWCHSMTTLYHLSFEDCVNPTSHGSFRKHHLSELADFPNNDADFVQNQREL